MPFLFYLLIHSINILTFFKSSSPISLILPITRPFRSSPSCIGAKKSIGVILNNRIY